MKRKKFSKKRFYRRLKAQGFVKGGYVNWSGRLEVWQLHYCSFPDLSKAAGKVAEKFKDVAESFKKFQEPQNTTASAKVYGVSCIEEFEVCGSDLTMGVMRFRM